MSVTELRIEGYRSIPSLTLSLKRVNVIVGPNGCGKSNLYQSISLLRNSASGTLAKALAAEGGLASALWAGPRSGKEQLRLGVTLDDYEYDLVLGKPKSLDTSLFKSDPIVKIETLSLRQKSKTIKVLERGVGTCYLRDADGERVSYHLQFQDAESVLDQIADPRQFPLLEDLRRKLLKWRFYHGFRTDSESPLRRPQVGVRTFVMAADGIDLAAALQTIFENGDGPGLLAAVSDAFPGAELIVRLAEGGLEVAMSFPGLFRPLSSRELSDGTLRYLCLLAAVFSPTPAPLLALNEPETSLNEDLMGPLARLLAKASEMSQLWLTTHSHSLADQFCELTGVMPIALDKVDGATVRKGRPKGLVYSAEFDG